MTKLFSFLREYKGVISSILGFILSFPINTYFIYMFLMESQITRERLEIIVIINILAITWYLMPSKIEIGGKIFTIKIED